MESHGGHTPPGPAGTPAAPPKPRDASGDRRTHPRHLVNAMVDAADACRVGASPQARMRAALDVVWAQGYVRDGCTCQARCGDTPEDEGGTCKGLPC